MPWPSQTTAPHGDSPLFSFLDQVPSPVLGRQERQNASMVRCLYPCLCIPTNPAEQPFPDFLDNIPASQQVTAVQVPLSEAGQPQDDPPQV